MYTYNRHSLPLSERYGLLLEIQAIKGRLTCVAGAHYQKVFDCAGCANQLNYLNNLNDLADIDFFPYGGWLSASPLTDPDAFLLSGTTTVSQVDALKSPEEIMNITRSMC